ncbi:MAG: hypothetical protein POELPBGB_01323 [Bacteroidia bacterium]|nr:hypothetical protein [Bacteroidia bacterium]
MKKPSETLFKLVKSMSKEEKVYFSKFIFIDKNNAKNLALNELFHVIDSMEEYDENQAKKILSNKLKNESFKTYKSLLKEKILQGLSAYGISASQRTSYRKVLDFAEILANKGLKRDALDMLEKAKETIIPEFHLTNLTAKTEIMTSKIWWALNSSGDTTAEVTQYAAAGAEITKDLQNAFEALSCSKKLLHLVYNNILLQKKTEKKIADDLIKQFNELTKSYKGDSEPLFVTEGRMAKAILELDFKRALEYSIEINKQYSSWYYNSFFPNTGDFAFYSKIIYMLATCVLLAKQDKKVFRSAYLNFLLKLGEKYSKTNNIPDHIYAIFQYGKLIKYEPMQEKENLIFSLRLEELTELSLWKETNPPMFLYRSLATWIGIVYYYLGNYDRALKWIRKVKATGYSDTECIHYVEFSLFFEFIIEYDKLVSERKNLNFSFYNSVESACDFVRKHSEIDRSFAAIFLLFFKSLKDTKKDSTLRSLIQLKKRFQMIQDTRAAIIFNAFFDFKLWIHKIESSINKDKVNVAIQSEVEDEK